MKTYFRIIVIIVFMQFLLIANIQSQVTDKEGNKYKTVKIGNQEWMAENLNTEYYSNGDKIPQVQDAKEWSNLTTGAWCYYENQSSNGVKNGKLYNWYAVNDPRGLAPEGWHIPKESEWKTLEDNNGGYLTAGKTLKSESGWKDNSNGTNKSGFNGLPSGFRNANGEYYSIGENAYWWGADTYGENGAWFHVICNKDDDIARESYNKKAGFSVRCLKF